LHRTKWSDGKKKRWKPLFKKITHCRFQWKNEENGYPVPDLNITMINVTKKPSDAHIKTLKEEIL
jgi:hypothetical protein